MIIPDLLEKLDKVKRSGNYHTARCPAHDDHENSLSVKESDGGKISLQCYAGCEIEAICSALEIKVSDLYPEEQRSNGRGGGWNIVAEYDYKDAEGALVFQVIRLDPKSFRQRKPDPTKPSGWDYKLGDIDRPLYNLPALTKAIEAGRKVVVVEGEKDVISLAKIGITATTCAGGASKWRRSYSDVLRRASYVIICPDNDEPGRKHAREISRALPDNSLIVELPGLPEKGDVSDWIAAGGTNPDFVACCNAAKRAADAAPPVVPPVPPVTAPAGGGNSPAPAGRYRALGFDARGFYFLSPLSQQVISLSASALGQKINFFRLAPISYWEMNFEDDYKLAANHLIQECHAAGIFRPDLRRGRGAWMDAGRVVLHQGDHLVADGKRAELLGFESGYFYERAEKIEIPFRAPLTDAQASELVKICQSFRWEHPIMGSMLAGWIALAPICGALSWRPHIWITGPSGSGKTWIDDNLVGRFLGDSLVKVQSNTTEAGIRQLLKQDALAVQFDEAELDDQRGQANIQRVLELARQASSESGSQIAKGTAGGEAQIFKIRSMFALSSISVGVHRRADETRVTVLALREAMQDPEGQAKFKVTARRLEELAAGDYGAQLVARSCLLARVIRENAETFAIAVGAVLKSRRMGDQIGALLAGSWSLWSDKAVTLDEATRYVSELTLGGLLPEEHGTDEYRALNHILEQRATVQVERVRVECSIGELLYAANGERAAYALGVTEKLAEKALRRFGLRTDGARGFYVSTTHSGIGGLLRGTPWAVNWAQFLRRLPGSEASENPVRFSAHKTRATLIPWEVVDGEDTEPSTPIEEALGMAGHEPDDTPIQEEL